jgi:linoleoyl-CoA desaturase
MSVYYICGKCYNLSKFINNHPGGTDVFNHLESYTDITPLVYSYHKDISLLFDILAKYEIPTPNNTIIKYKTDYTYDKYVAVKTLVYNEITAKELPLYWSNTEIARNMLGFLLYLSIWAYCWNLDYVHPMWFVLLSFINVGHCALIFHETSHYAGFKWQPLNTLISNIAVAPIITTEEWKWDHNYLHHCFTNTNYDKDYNGHTRLLRHSPIQPHYYQHQFQHIYAPVLFCLGGLSGQIDSIKYERMNFLLFMSILYRFGVQNTLVFYFLTGFLFLFIAQLSHIQTDCVMHLNTCDFLANQVSSTMNFKLANPFARFICFGLDIQIEHHLFPNIPHSTLRQVQGIVRDYCVQQGIPYVEKQSLYEIAKSYFTHLYETGKRPIRNI